MLIFQYLHRHYGMQPLFLEAQMTVLTKVFKTLTLKIGDICDINSIPKTYTKNIQWEALYDEGSTLAYYVYDRFKDNSEHFATNRFLNIGPYANQLYLYKDSMAELAEQLQFKVWTLHSFSFFIP